MHVLYIHSFSGLCFQTSLYGGWHNALMVICFNKSFEGPWRILSSYTCLSEVGGEVMRAAV